MGVLEMMEEIRKKLPEGAITEIAFCGDQVRLRVQTNGGTAKRYWEKSLLEIADTGISTPEKLILEAAAAMTGGV